MSSTFLISDSRLLRRVAVVSMLAAGLAACSPEINHRGYYPKAGALAQVSEGMPKTEVEGILGSPSTTASVNFQGDSYYYITSITEGRSFLDPVELKREVIAVRFDQQDQVTSVAQYGLEDGRIINLNDRTTPVPGSEFNIMKELFKRPGVSNYGKRGTIKDRF